MREVVKSSNLIQIPSVNPPANCAISAFEGSCHEWDTNPVSQKHTNLSRKRERLSVAKAVPANHVAQVCRDMAT